MYDRTLSAGVAGERRELHLEASGALKKATLVMRDLETDSWWSIMTSTAIGGELEGERLVELPVGRKTTWAEWRETHPQTLVLSIDGVEHEPRDGYADYWTSDGTFRDLEIADTRLPAKEPVYAFAHAGRAYAAAHKDFADGRFFDLATDGSRVYLHRTAAASIRASSRALLLPPGIAGEPPGGHDLETLVAAGARPLSGFDTYWYGWVAIHPETDLLTEPER